MADLRSSLPIRTQNPGDVSIKLVDSGNTALGLKIEADGSINANISTGDLDVRDLQFATDKVDVTGSEISISNFPPSFEISNFSALADLDIRNLDKDQDSVTAHLAAGSEIKVTEMPADLDIRTLSSASDSITAFVDSSSVVQVIGLEGGALNTRTLDKDSDAITAHFAAGSSLEVSNFPASFEVSNFPSLADLDIRDLNKDQDSVTAHLASGSQIEVTAMPADLDIRNLDKDQDSMTAHLAAGSEIKVTEMPADLDMRDLQFATDKVDATGSEVSISNFPQSFEVSNFSALADLDIRNLDKDQDSVMAHLAAGSQIEVTAMPADLDMRDLAFATDKVDVSGSSIEVSNLADLDVRDLNKDQDSVMAHLATGSEISVNSMPADLDIRDLNKDQDSVMAHLATGSEVSVNSMPADLDIRSLDAASDSVSVHGLYNNSGQEILVDNLGAIAARMVHPVRKVTFSRITNVQSVYQGGGSVVLEYTNTTDKTERLYGFKVCASGKFKAAFAIETTEGAFLANPSTNSALGIQALGVVFGTPACPNVDQQYWDAVKIPPGLKARVLLFNIEDSASQDIYATIIATPKHNDGSEQ